MTFFNTTEPDNKVCEEQDEKIDRGFLAVILVALPIIISPLFTGKTELLIGVSMSAAVNVLAIAKCWNLKRYVWFWVVVSLIMALHVSLAFLDHWPRVAMTRFTILPIGVLYYCLTLGVVRFVGRFIMKSPPPDEEV